MNRGNREGGGDVAGALLEAARGNVLKRAENRKIPSRSTAVELDDGGSCTG